MFKNIYLLFSVFVNNGKSFLNVWWCVFCDIGFIFYYICIEVNKMYIILIWLLIGLFEVGYVRGFLREFLRIYVNLYNIFFYFFLFVYVIDYF